MNETCIHLLDPATCSMCNQTSTTKATQTTLNFASIETAVNDLATQGAFRTRDVASHPVVMAAHPQYLTDPRFAQHMGRYLSDSRGALRIRQLAPKDQANARWQCVTD